jgi:nodulation protein E
MGRKGTVLGEGAVSFLLASDKVINELKYDPVLEILGYGFSNDCVSMAHTSCEAMVGAMTMAVNQSGVESNDVNYIAAHGTGTKVSDTNELSAINQLFGENDAALAINTIKPICGHTIGAAAGFSLAGVIAQKRGKSVFPNVNLSNPDSIWTNPIPRQKPVGFSIRYALINAFALGGSCASLICKAC